MERYKDQPLGPAPHIGILTGDKLGGFVVTTPLLRGLKERFPKAVVDFFGGERTSELEVSSKYVDWRYSLFGRQDSMAGLPRAIARRQDSIGPYDLAINLDFDPATAFAAALLNPRYVAGPAIRQDGRGQFLSDDTGAVDRLQTDDWSADDLLERYGGLLTSGFIGEIYCRRAYVETDFFSTEVTVVEPAIPVPDLLISTGATRPAKLWSTVSWIRFIQLCEAEGWTVGLLGAAPAYQRTYGVHDAERTILEKTGLVDLRGKLSLPQVAGALQEARACVTIDNGILHLAYSVGTPTVAIIGASPVRLWMPPVGNLHLVSPAEPCNLCHENRYRNPECLLPVHQCMNSISPQAALAKLKMVIRSSQLNQG